MVKVMKVNKMMALIDEMIGILKHNEAISLKVKAQGYQGFLPSYQAHQAHMLKTKEELVALNAQHLTEECQEQLEKACECYCLGQLVHGARNDEFYLCKLQQANANSLFLAMEDVTRGLANKYELKIEMGVSSNRYFDQYDALIAKIRSEHPLSLTPK
jgi:hypothetical protein